MDQAKRITFKHTRPNPLFQIWLEELYNEAKTKKSKLEFMLQEALTSLSKYPLVLETGLECAILKGFDKRLCLFIDKRLEVYKNQKVLTSTSTEDKVNVIVPSNAPHISEEVRHKTKITSLTNDFNGATKKTFKSKKYMPTFRSGSYAILIALLEYSKENSNHYISKELLIEKAQCHSEESFTRPKPDSFYTAWSNMTKLISKGLVKKLRKKKIVYALTESGASLANDLLKSTENIPTNNDIINTMPSTSNSMTEETILKDLDQEVTNTENVIISQDAKTKEPIELPAGYFDVILLIDKNETSGVSKKSDPTVAQFKKYSFLKHEYRNLKVSDFIWIARHKEYKDLELVLPFAVERKRMDDLGASVKDGRFHEQKFRLRKCGLKNVIYLVENYGSNKHVGLPIQSLMQALANTRIQDRFKVHMTDSLTNTARFLAIMTKRLTIEYKDKTLIGSQDEPHQGELMTYTFFNKSSIKNKPLTVTETFIKLLLQLKGVSVEKALAITNAYRTPKSLIECYKTHSPSECEMLLANLKYSESSRNIGPSISRSIYQLFSNKDLI